jgi:hypothetical protein
LILSLEDLLSAPPRRRFRSASLFKRIAYLKREGATRDGEDARMFDATSDAADTKAFTERCGEGGITSGSRCRTCGPDGRPSRLYARGNDGRRARPRNQSQLGRGRSLETDGPHIHLLVRGRADDGQDLVISRGYISKGFWGRAAKRVKLELGPRREQEIRPDLENEVGRNAGQVSTDRSATSRVKAEESSTYDRSAPAKTPSYAG